MNEMSQPRPMAPIQADAPIEVVLAAQDWNVVLAGLNELPMRVSRMVFDRILSQIQAKG